MNLIAAAMGKLRGMVSALQSGQGSERGYRPTPENQQKYLYRQMWVDPDLRAAILDIRDMDRRDGRVKTIHSRVAQDAIKGGLVFTQPKPDEAIKTAWADFSRRAGLNRAEKLRSHARGLAMEGSLPLQVVLDQGMRVIDLVRMPAETILPKVAANGRFSDVAQAYAQFDIMTGRETATFAMWQLILVRLDPDNYDDMGSMGRPFLDAVREDWKKLRMSEQDLVLRRRMRSPLRMAHVLEGASDVDLEKYQDRVEKSQAEGITQDYYLNKKGGITAIQGDATLGDIGDVVHLMDTFFAGTPLPKGLMGFTDGMARDILDDLKRAYYEVVDSLQDTLSGAYEQAFRLELLFKGINPDDAPFAVGFAERNTETLSQTTDRGLKLKALGFPQGVVDEILGYNADDMQKRREWEAKNYDPYPAPDQINAPAAPMVKVTPGNARKGESGTAVGNG